MQIFIGTSRFEACRVFCIGRNYAAHARELNNEAPSKPVVFMKPPTCLVSAGTAIPYPQHGRLLHHEAELVVAIGKQGRARSADDARGFVAGISLGLDLTVRDVQDDLRAHGLPWEASKAFDHSAPIGAFVPVNDSVDLHDISFSCTVNGDVRQRGNSGDMIFSVETLIVEIGRIWLLRPGDLIYTGTPEGVGPLRPQDRVQLHSDTIGTFAWEIS